MSSFKKLGLEISLKPFYDLSDSAIENVFVHLFTQWKAMIEEADEVAVMYWAADGSEILDYRGRMEDTFEWCKYFGGANTRVWDKKADPERVGLHSRCYLYRSDAPEMTYGDLRRINLHAREVFARMYDKPFTLTETFDPGPEFAKSSFKYERHPEILRGVAMGEKSFVCCYATLHADKVAYAAYPDGIPEGTPFGTFFGKQCARFLPDLGFDAVWLSNGFGFGTESWGVTGAIFDGEQFEPDKIPETESRILDFWKLFRAECPDIQIETRGTNLMTGIDYTTDAVNYKKLYNGGFNFLPPPNSPWAALDGDFGLEIAGYLSRIAELPKDEYLFRYYLHDPWWVNSPWLDRYEGQPHDIYLPLAACRLRADGSVNTPTHLTFLSVDNSYGELPDRVPEESIPHLRRGYRELPDEASPLVWVYPFNEYQSAGTPGYNAAKPFFEDWYMRAAMDEGLPVATVVSTGNFSAILEQNAPALQGRVIVSPYPNPGTPWETALLHFLDAGGRVLLYGRAVPGETAERLGLRFGEAIEGSLTLTHTFQNDVCEVGTQAMRLFHNPIISDGGIDVVAATQSRAEVNDEQGKTRVYAAQAGNLLWVRGTLSADWKKGSHLLVPHVPSEWFNAGRLARLMLRELGFGEQFRTVEADCKLPVVMMHRHDHAVLYSIYNPNTTTETVLDTELGAPMLLGFEARMSEQGAAYHFPRAVRAECRAFVRQKEGVAHCIEDIAVSAQIDRRITLSGLRNADVYWLPEGDDVDVSLNAPYPHVISEPFQSEWVDTIFGRALHIQNATGTLRFGRYYQGYIED